MKYKAIFLIMTILFSPASAFAADEISQGKDRNVKGNFTLFIQDIAKKSTKLTEQHEAAKKAEKPRLERLTDALENYFKRAAFATIYLQDYDFQKTTHEGNFVADQGGTKVSDPRLLGIYEVCMNLARYGFLTKDLNKVVNIFTADLKKAKEAQNLQETEFSFLQRLMLIRITLMYHAELSGDNYGEDLNALNQWVKQGFSTTERYEPIIPLPAKEEGKSIAEKKEIYDDLWQQTERGAQVIYRYLQSDKAPESISFKFIENLNKNENVEVPDFYVSRAFRSLESTGPTRNEINEIAQHHILKYPFLHYFRYQKSVKQELRGAKFLKAVANANVMYSDNNLSERAENILQVIEDLLRKAYRTKNSLEELEKIVKFQYENNFKKPMDLKGINEEDLAEVFIPKDLRHFIYPPNVLDENQQMQYINALSTHDYLTLNDLFKLEDLYKDPSVLESEKLEKLPIPYLAFLAKRSTKAFNELERRSKESPSRAKAIELFLRLEGLTLGDIQEQAREYEKQVEEINETVEKNVERFYNIIGVSDLAEEQIFRDNYLARLPYDTHNLVENIVVCLHKEIREDDLEWKFDAKIYAAQILLKWFGNEHLKELVIDKVIQEMLPEPDYNSFKNLKQAIVLPEEIVENTPEDRIDKLIYKKSSKLAKLIRSYLGNIQAWRNDKTLREEIVPELLEIFKEYFEKMKLKNFS